MALEVNLTTEMLKNYLRVEHDFDDPLIEKFKKSAISEADGYLNQDYQSTDEVPAEVDIWVMNRVATYYENRQGNVPKPDYSSIQKYRRYPMASDVVLDEDS